AAASSLVVSGFPSSIIAGVAGTFTVTAQDAYGNIATGYGGTVHFNSNTPQAQLPSHYIFAAAHAGVHAFSATFKIVGTRSLTAPDPLTSTITLFPYTTLFRSAAASSLVVSGFPSSIIAGVAGTFTVTAQDAYGNIATGYGGTV